MLRRYLAALVAAAIFVSACTGAATPAPTTAPTAAAPTAAAATAAAPSAAAPSVAVTNPPISKKITVVVPNPSGIVWFNLCTAMGEGFLAQEGIEVTFEALDGSGAVLQAMVAGKAQIGAPGPGPTLVAWENGETPVMFYDQYPRSLFGLVVPANSPIQAVADLKGKVIGTGTVDGAEVAYARSILTDAGLKEKTDYTFLSVGDGGPATAAFQRNEIAAYSAATSDMAIIQARGLALKEITPEKFLTFFGNSYTTLQSTIDKDPELIAGFTRAIVKGTTFAYANKDKTLADCAKLNPQEATDAALASALYDAQTARSKPIGSNVAGTFTLDAWKAWQDSLLASGGLKAANPDLTKVFTNTFVEQAQ